MKKVVNYFYNVRRGEWLAMSLMFFLHFMLMVTLYLLKPARDSLFLSEIGPQQLPFVYLLLAAVAIPVTLFISRIGQRYKTKQLLKGSLLFYIANLLVLRWLFSFQEQWIYLLFYIWVGIFGILVISQFWLYANALFDAAQSKRLFPLLNLGAILGAIAGSEGTSLLVGLIDLTTEDLLYLSIAVLGICWVLVNNTSDRRSSAPKEVSSEKAHKIDSGTDVLKQLLKSRYQLLIASIIGMAMLVSTLIDYQFKTLATESFPDAAALTTFMGSFYGGISIASLGVQILFSTQIIKQLGIGGAVLSRPVGLLAGALVFFIEPVLASAVILQGIDRSTRYSIDKTGRELLYLPLSQHAKQRTKVFIDTFVNRFFRGIAGILLLLFIYVMELSLQQMTYAVVIALGIWIILSFWARRAYVDQFRNSLRKRYINIDQIVLNLDESVAFNAVQEMLQSDKETRIIYGLSLLEDSNPEKMSEELGELLSHSHSEIRLQALKLLSGIESVNFAPRVEPLLHDPKPNIRLEAVYYLCGHSNKNSKGNLQYYLEQENETLKAAAMGCMHEHGMQSDIETEEEFIEKVLSNKERYSVVIQAQIAQMLGNMPKKTKAIGYLSELLQNREPIVVRNTLKSVSRLQSDLFLDKLFELLQKPDFVVEVQQVLASYGADYFSMFQEWFYREDAEFEIRREVPGIFTRAATQQSADYLTDMLVQPNPALRYHVIKALNKLNSRKPGFTFDAEKIHAVLRSEAKTYFELLSIKLVQRDNIPNNILIKALNEKMDQVIERLFRLAGLISDQQHDIYGAYLAFKSHDNESRATSLEFMDNILDTEAKKYIIPIIESFDEKEKLKRGRIFFDLPVDSYEQGVLKLLNGNDIWLKACALFNISPSCPSPLQEQLQASANGSNKYSPLIKETAQYVVKRNSKTQYAEKENSKT